MENIYLILMVMVVTGIVPVMNVCMCSLRSICNYFTMRMCNAVMHQHQQVNGQKTEAKYFLF